MATTYRPRPFAFMVDEFRLSDDDWDALWTLVETKTLKAGRAALRARVEGAIAEYQGVSRTIPNDAYFPQDRGQNRRWLSRGDTER